MSKKLVIVESPAKARTVGRFLGKDYSVEASIGHIRDLPQNRLGVDVDNDFEPRYVIPQKKKDVVKRLKGEARGASDVYLATDPDREGEAISWHLVKALGLKDGTAVHRVEFHEITREAIDEAFRRPREINLPLVDAQQARRILDRLVGYKISPLLRRKITKKGLSAGRVQSVAVKLVVEREREIEAFVKQEYWTIGAELAKRSRGRARRSFVAQLHQIDGNKVDLRSEDEARTIEQDLAGARFVVAEVRRREMQRNPAAPFTTSTLQQEASRKLGFTARRTMAVAQQLYEGVPIEAEGSVGLITYMRTDSTNIAASAQEQTREYIAQRFGPDFVPEKPRVFKAKSKGAQEAHEAIRPTSVHRQPEDLKPYLSSDQFKLYRLIWRRLVASQMAAAILDTTSIDIQAVPVTGSDNSYIFRASGSTVKFPGFTAVYVEGRDEGDPEDEEEPGKKALPSLEKDEELDLLKLLPEQHFTQPPPRYTEATLVKALEAFGIGRPSTYAPTLSTIQARGYVDRVGRQLQPTSIGIIVNDLLVEHFPDIVDIGFTARMEEQLDEIAANSADWVQVLQAFYGPFEKTLQTAETAMPAVVIEHEPTGEICPECGNELVIKWGRFGRFIACRGYPACRNTKSLAVKIGTLCPRCGGDVVEKKTRRKRIFYGCSQYPACEFAVWNRPLPQEAQPCQACGGLLLEATRGEVKCNDCGETIPRDEMGTTPTADGGEKQSSSG